MGGPSFCVLLALPVALPGVLVVRLYLCAFLALSGLLRRSGAFWRGLYLDAWRRLLSCPGLVPWRRLLPVARSVARGGVLVPWCYRVDRSRGFRAFLGLLGAF